MPPRDSLPVSWDQLQTFLVIGRCRTLTEAGIALGITTSAVSQRLTLLEDRIGVGLLHRSNRGIRLSEAGRRLLERCRSMQTIADDAGRAMRETATMEGVLRITCPHGIIDSLLIPALGSFLKLHPKLRYEIIAADERIDLQEASIDVALRFGWVKDGNFVARRLAGFEEFICASPEYLRRHGTPTKPEELAMHDWIGYSGRGNLPPLLFKRSAAQSIDVSLRPRVLTTNAASIVPWMVHGLGISRQPEPLVTPHIKAGRLVRLLDNWTLQGPTLYAAYRRIPGAVRLKKLVEHLSRVLSA